jgi:hypothetical protein
MKVRRTLAAAGGGVLLSAGLMAAPAQAQPNSVAQEGLVNLAITDTTVQVPIAVAADVCGVAVNVLAQELVQGPVECTAEGVAFAERNGGGGNNNVAQQGLVNVAVTDTTVQVPVGIAANICGVAVNLLASQTSQEPVECTAEGVAIAESA